MIGQCPYCGLDRDPKNDSYDCFSRALSEIAAKDIRIKELEEVLVPIANTPSERPDKSATRAHYLAIEALSLLDRINT